MKIKRIYDLPEESDGVRILIDRLWPRGLSKDKAKIDLWLKDVAPSTDLRKWFGHDRTKWKEFKHRYFNELKHNGQSIDPIFKQIKGSTITLLFGSKDAECNNAIALKEFIDEIKF